MTLMPFENAEIEIKDQIIAYSKKPNLDTTHFFTICRRMHIRRLSTNCTRPPEFHDSGQLRQRYRSSAFYYRSISWVH